MKFEWDENKNLANICKHDFDFKDAEELFSHSGVLVFHDNRKDYSEIRYIGFGKLKGRIVNMVFTKRNDFIRVISLRKANLREVTLYEKQIKNKLG